MSLRIPGGCNRGLTLVELLVSIAIVATLTAIALPTATTVWERSRRLACANNFRQCGVALYAYAGDYEDVLPRVNNNSGNDADIYRLPGFTSMVTYMKPYVGSFTTWRCAAVRAAPIDDPRNTEPRLRASIVYWPHLSYGSSPLGFISPANLSHHGSKTVLMQDELYLFSGKWRANHSKGGAKRIAIPANPSLEMYFDGYPRGANILFGDGRVSWFHYGPKFTRVFRRTSSDFYSLREFLQ